MSNFIPNSFQVPNDLVDEEMKNMSIGEIKCYLVIIRKTVGWHKEFDAISVSQFVKFTGLSNRVVIKACKTLVDKGIIEKKTGERNINIYSINFNANRTCDEKSLVTNNHSTCDEKSLDPMTNSHTQSNKKHTIQKTNTYSKTSKVSAAKVPPELDLEAWKTWLDYKANIKSKYKTEHGELAKMKQLISISLETGASQQAIVDQSVTEEWKGLYALKTKQLQTFNQPTNDIDMDDTSWANDVYITVD